MSFFWLGVHTHTCGYMWDGGGFLHAYFLLFCHVRGNLRGGGGWLAWMTGRSEDSTLGLARWLYGEYG